jgi:YVTN family beta-propeller protein
VINGKLYLAGGSQASIGQGYTNALEVYDPATDTWTAKAPMPLAIASAASGVIGGRLYVAGGNLDAPSYATLNTLEVYDPATDTWTTKAPLPAARSGLDGENAVINGLLYVAGGFAQNPTQTPVNTLWVYNPLTDTWTTKAPMPTGRVSPGVGVLNGILYAGGGRDAASNPLATFESYQPSTDTWTTEPSLPTARNAPFAVGLNGVLYVGGGNEVPGHLSGDTTVYAFTPAATATVVGSISLGSRSGVGQLAVNPITDNIYVASGFGPGQLQVVNASNPANPTLVTTTSAQGWGAVVNPVTNRYYTGDGYSGDILVYDGISNNLLATVHVGYCGGGFDIDTTRNLVYSTWQCGGGNDPLFVLDGNTNAIVAGPLGSGGVNSYPFVNTATGYFFDDRQGTAREYSPSYTFVADLSWAVAAVNPRTNRIYSTSPSTGSDLQVRDGTSGALIATIPGAATGQVGVNTSLNRLYVTDPANHSVDVIDGATNSAIGNIPLGANVNPYTITVDSVKNRVYVVASLTGGTTTLFVIQDNPISLPPVITSLSPSSAQEGGATFTLTVNGANFTSSSTVKWNSTALATTFVSSTQLQATVPAANVAEEGSTSITVSDPSGGTSNAQTFTITDPAVSPTGGFTISATEGFNSGSQKVATFTDPGGAEAVGDYSATINWGDGSTSPGTVSPATWAQMAPMPTARGLAGADVINGLLYVVGGGTASDLNKLEVYDPATNTWATKAPMPTPRHQMAVGAINGLLYVAGGYHNGTVGTLEVYNPASDTWTTKTPMPLPTESRGAVVNGILYVIGGNASGYCTNVVEAYNPATDTWSYKSPMPTPRCHLEVEALNGLIYAMGGTNTSGTVSYSTVEVYSPGSDSWTTAASMPTPASLGATAVLNNEVLVLGGLVWTSGTYLATVQAYDPSTNSWTAHTLMPTARYGPAAGAINNVVYAVGGYNGGYLATNETFPVFTVSGSHQYAEEGSYPINVTIHHDSAPNASAKSTATVADPAVAATGGFTVSATEGANSGSQTVATFTDPGGAEALTDYSAIIAWGDNTTSAGTINYSNGVFTVSGSHQYAEEGSYAIAVTIHHDSAPDATAKSTASVADPAVAATGGFAVRATEGANSGSQTVATFTDPGGAEALTDYSATIAWGDNATSSGTITYSNGVFTVSGSHQYAEEGSYPITVTIHHDSAPNATANSSAAVADANLDATGQNSNGQEGIPLSSAVALFTDADPNGTTSDYTATINWGDGSPASSGTISPTFAVNGSHTYAEEGAYTVSVTIRDQGGSAATAMSTVTIAIVAPTASISGPGNGVPGQPRTFTFAATHPSPVDQAAGFIYTINWGDGTSVQTIPRSPSNGAGIALDHIYTTTGSYTVQVSATEDGGSSGTASQSLTLLRAEVQGTDLAVGGTTGNDNIFLYPTDTVGHIAVTVNFVAQGSFLPTGHILVYSQAGNDNVALLPNLINGQYVQIAVPAVLFAGNGNDILSAAGSSANNVLVGGSGNNLLTGGTGRNILIAGSGTSTLVGGTGQDILIGGSTDFDHNLTALYALIAEWGRTDASYATRVSHLNGSLAGGLNGSFFLNSTTVHGNANADLLIGGLGPDWFFAGVNDQLLFVFPGEVITNI